MWRSSCRKIYIYILRIVEYVPCPVFEPGGRLEFHQRRETIRSSKGCQCFHGSRNRYGREAEKKTRGERLLCLIRESLVRVVNPFCDAKVGPSETGPSRLLQPSILPTFSLFQIFFFLLFFSFDPPSSPFSVLSLSLLLLLSLVGWFSDSLLPGRLREKAVGGGTRPRRFENIKFPGRRIN